MRTTVIVEIEHSKPLPEGVTDALADRAYQFAHARGQMGLRAEVVARMEVCRFPYCNCPMDPGPDPDWCARGLPHERKQ